MDKYIYYCGAAKELEKILSKVELAIVCKDDDLESLRRYLLVRRQEVNHALDSLLQEMNETYLKESFLEWERVENE